MKKTYFIVAVGLLVLLFALSAQAVTTRYIRIGRMWAKNHDHGQFAETSGTSVQWYYTRRGFQGSVVRCSGTRFGVANWTDEDGNFYSVKCAGAPYGSADNFDNWFEIPHPEYDDLTIVRYFRYQPPTITVDGFTYHDRFPLEGDFVDASKIPGTAEVMTESYIRNWLGMDMRLRCLAWSTKQHDDYVIYEWTFTNSGNVDRDDDVELSATLEDMYIMRQQEIFPNTAREWTEYVGELMSDSVRVFYSTPYRSKNDTEDRFGIGRDRSFIGGQDRTYSMSGRYVGEATLYMQTAWNDVADNLAQPRMHSVSGPDDLAFKLESGRRPQSDWLLFYSVCQNGYNEINPCLTMDEAFPALDVYPNTAHDVEFPKRGAPYMEDYTWWFWHHVASAAYGPYDLPQGESIKLVLAIVGGDLDPATAWDVYEAWDAGTCTWPAWEAGGENDLADVYPTFADFPEVAPTANDQAKDRWVASSRDSLLRNTMAATWNYQQGYNAPIAPPPPSIEVNSLPDRISITWGSESESAADFAGYNIYRASGWPHYHRYQGQVLGDWELIATFNGTGTHSYDDATAERGTAYFYYVTAFDDGTQNGQDVYGNNQVLESSRFLSMTTAPAYLTRPPGDSMDDIRVVPNPFNVYAAEMNYTGEPNKIMFLDLPFDCTIKIYTETLELIKTIEHTGSGDEAWGVALNDHMTTETGQLVVSGLYIALIETPDGESAIRKFVIVR